MSHNTWNWAKTSPCAIKASQTRRLLVGYFLMSCIKYSFSDLTTAIAFIAENAEDMEVRLRALEKRDPEKVILKEIKTELIKENLPEKVPE